MNLRIQSIGLRKKHPNVPEIVVKKLQLNRASHGMIVWQIIEPVYRIVKFRINILKYINFLMNENKGILRKSDGTFRQKLILQKFVSRIKVVKINNDLCANECIILKSSSWSKDYSFYFNILIFIVWKIFWIRFKIFTRDFIFDPLSKDTFHIQRLWLVKISFDFKFEKVTIIFWGI